jgi:hypothetical protein
MRATVITGTDAGRPRGRALHSAGPPGTNANMPSHFPNVFARFPEHWRILRRLLTNDSAFEELCADYETCLQHLHALSPATSQDFEREVVVYRETARELEDEIRLLIAGMHLQPAS